MIFKHIFFITFLNEPELKIKEFQVLLLPLVILFNIAHSFAQCFKYWYVSLTIQLITSYVFTHS